MARIADKHGLTNRYRENGHKRVVKRGRSRTKLWSKGKSRRRSSTYALSSIENNAGCLLLILIALFVFILLIFISLPPFRCIIPVIIGGFILWFIDDSCKKAWGLPRGKNSKPASWAWYILSALSITANFFIVLLIQIEQVSIFILIVAIILYIVLSIWLLSHKHKKIERDKELKKANEI